MSVNSQPIYSYPKTLFETWAHWSREALSEVPDDAFKSLTGFQHAVGGSNSSARTQAGDIYRLGMLRGRLVKAKNGGQNFPSAWASICRGETAHAKAGFLAYAIGSALRAGREDQVTVDAADALTAIVMMNIGFRVEESWYSTGCLYTYLLNQFTDAKGDTLSDHEKRALAGAMFNTLDAGDPTKLLKCYRDQSSGSKIELTLLVSDGPVLRLSTANFFDEVNSENFDINGFEKFKGALFWSAPGKGIYSSATRRTGTRLVEALMSVDAESVRTEQQSIFAPLFEDLLNEEGELDCISFIGEIAKSDPTLTTAWRSILKTLAQGVYESLEYIREESATSAPTKFFLHDELNVAPETQELTLRISKQNLPITPAIGAKLNIDQNLEFVVEGVRDEGDTISLELTR